jgi:hypothetical protein
MFSTSSNYSQHLHTPHPTKPPSRHSPLAFVDVVSSGQLGRPSCVTISLPARYAARDTTPNAATALIAAKELLVPQLTQLPQKHSSRLAATPALQQQASCLRHAIWLLPLAHASLRVVVIRTPLVILHC